MSKKAPSGKEQSFAEGNFLCAQLFVFFKLAAEQQRHVIAAAVPHAVDHNDHRMAKSIEVSIDFAAKRQVWQEL